MRAREGSRAGAGDGVEPAIVLADAAAGEAAQDPTVYGDAGTSRKSSISRALLDQAPAYGAQTGRGVATTARLWLMKRMLVPLFAQACDEVEHLGLHGRVEPVVGSSSTEQRGVGRERHGDQRALLHPTESWCG